MEELPMESRQPTVFGAALVDLLVAIAVITILALILLPVVTRRIAQRRLARLRQRIAQLQASPSATREECEALNVEIEAFNRRFGDVLGQLDTVPCGDLPD
jgi:Tfp pilus assembly protein FimT